MPSTCISTMRERIDDFSGSLEEYIEYLEVALLDLRKRLTTVTVPTGTVEGDGRPQDQCQVTNISEDLEDRNHNQTSTIPHKRPHQLEIVQWEPGNENPRHKKARLPLNAPWRRLAQTLVQETPFANDWAGTLRVNGVHDMMSTGKAVTILLGPEYEPNAPTIQDRPHAIVDEQGAFGRVREYARAATQKGLDAAAALMLANFQKFLVFCLCNVMRDSGIPLGDVYGIVRICLGNVTDDYCCRVLRAAVYLNQLVDALYMDGWGLRASELLLLCKLLLQSSRSTKSYGSH